MIINGTLKVELNSTLLTILNDYSFKKSWSNWSMFHMNGGKIGKIDKEFIIAVNEYPPKPKPKKEYYTFSGWFKDATLNEKFDFTTTDAYAKWTINQYALTFNFGNGTDPEVKLFDFNTSILYPESVLREGYSFIVWDNIVNFMPAYNFTTTALWMANNYTVTFNAMGGDLSLLTKEVTYDQKYGDLPEVTRNGYMFDGWFSEIDNKSVTNETIVSISSNHTLYCQWKEITNQVEIVFGSKDMTEEDIRHFVERYVSAREFTIVKFEGNDLGGVTVIISFIDKDAVVKFVNGVKLSNDNDAKLIKRIDFNSANYHEISFTVLCYPNIFFCYLFTYFNYIIVIFYSTFFFK